jgi:outer membrane protein assembly factor BamB
MAVLQLVDGDGGGAFRSAAAPPTLDLLVDGINLTARVADVELGPLLCELGVALAAMAALKASRRSVRCYGSDGSWEIGLERAGERVLVSLFRVGPEPEVAVFERDVEFVALVHAALSAMEKLEADTAHASMAPELARARVDLAATPIAMAPPAAGRRAVEVEPEGEASVRISAEIALRLEGTTPAVGAATVERADLFGLLVRGTVRIGIGDRVRVFSDRLVFLFAEHLLTLASEAQSAWEQGRGFYRRAELAGVVMGVRFDPKKKGREDGLANGEGGTEFWLSVNEPSPARSAEGRNFLLPDARGFVEASVHFGRALARAFLRHDPGQKQNLRLSAFRRAVRVLDERLHEAERDDTKVNPSPEAYRVFAMPPPVAVHPETSRLAFKPVWTAAMAAIDLRATFLCGDHLVVGALREIACIDRRTGRFVWRRPAEQGLSIVTTAGMARLFVDGRIALYDFASGEIALASRVAPRAGGIMTGVAVSSPGLPRLLVVCEGKRHLSAVDLRSGEVRWRHAARGGAVFRLRRAGRLLIVVAGDAALTALDLASGEVVWRARDRLRFSAHVGLDHDSLFALAGDPDDPMRGALRLHHLDPYAGVTRWARELLPGTRPLGAPLVTDGHVVLVTSDRRGLGLSALDRATGQPSWTVRPGLFPVTSAWLAVDDSVVINCGNGDLLSVATESGAVRWRQRFARGMEGDAPRRLEPILRSGALFVPQQEVQVVRPRDGAVLGSIPTQVIPDLLRVDERCDVYVAEESGHIAAFRAGARLSLVSSTTS